MPGRAEQRRDNRRDHSGVEAVLRRHAGDGGERHSLGQHDERAGEPGDKIVAQVLSIDSIAPAQEG